MSSKPFPMGVVVTLTILWLGLVGAMAWGWISMREVFDSPPRPAASGVSATAPASPAADGAATTLPASSGPRVVWTQEGLQRFGIKAGGAAMAAILFLLLAVGAGMLVQEKAESTGE